MGFLSPIASHFTISLLWVLLNVVIRVISDIGSSYLGIYGGIKQAVNRAMMVALIFLFYWLGKLLGGATYNPLTAIAFAAAPQPQKTPLYTLAVLLPAQVAGSIGGVWAARVIIPMAYKHTLTGPYLQVHPHIGAFIEGLLSFAVVLIVLLTNSRGPKSGIKRTWITSISRVCLSILGNGYTGPALNPANAFGWAFSRNQHNSWEHVYVYWMTPFLATLAAVWAIHFLPEPKKAKEKKS